MMLQQQEISNEQKDQERREGVKPKFAPPTHPVGDTNMTRMLSKIQYLEGLNAKAVSPPPM